MSSGVNTVPPNQSGGETRAAHAIITVSRTITFPLTLLAARRDAFGRLIVATDAGGTAQYSAAQLGSHSGWTTTGLATRGVAVLTQPTGRAEVVVSSGESFPVPD